MKILFDTNVVLDLLLDRKPFSQAAAVLFSLAETGALAGYVCATTVTTIFYLVRKSLGAARAQEEIGKLLTLLEVAPVTRPVLEAARLSDFSDFEDGVIYEAARHANVQGIVTRNPSDFKLSALPVYLPEELCAIIQAEQEDSGDA